MQMLKVLVENISRIGSCTWPDLEVSLKVVL